MTSLQIRNLPDEVHRKLKARAAQRGQSLSDYAAQVLANEADTISIAEHWERIKARGPISTATTEDIVKIIREGRDSR